MGKSKKKKNKDFQKIKLKIGKKLKKPNETETAFKTKKVLLLEQLKNNAEKGSNQLVSKKKLNLQELCQHTRHYNVNVRKDAINGLKEIISQQNYVQTKADLKAYIEILTPLVSDLDSDVRKLTFSTLKNIFEKVNSIDVAPMFHLIVAHLICASTHLNSKIKLFSVKLLELLLDSLPDLCKGDWNLLKSFSDMLNFREKNVDKSRKTAFLVGLFRILDVNYRKLDENNLVIIDDETPKKINPKNVSLTSKLNAAPFDFPVVANLFWTKNSCDEILNAKNLNYLLERVIPFCHSFWVELTTSDDEKTTDLYDLETLKILSNVLKIYILLIEQIKNVEDSLDVEAEDNSNLMTTFKKYFRNVSFLKRYANVFPCQVKRKNVVDEQLSDVCSTINLLICDICSSHSTEIIDKQRVNSFLQRINRRKNNSLETKVSYATKIASIYDVTLDVIVENL